MKKYFNHINGNWQPSSNDEFYVRVNPADPSEKLGKFPLSTVKDVEMAVDSAEEAGINWSSTPGPARGKLLYKFADLLEKSKEDLAKIITLEQGKAYGESLGEVKRAVVETRYVAGEASRIFGQTFPSEHSHISAHTILEPLGVIAAISPWNFPIVTPVRKIVPALAFGNSVVFKPATDTPLSAIRIVELFEKAGFPKGVVNLVIGSGKIVGNSLVSNLKVNGISFTGSTGIGLKIYEEAARRNAKVQLELGGKNPAVIWDFNNLERAVDEIVSAAFLCSGQRCTALSRVIVSDKQADKVVELLASRIKGIKVGNGLEEGTKMGPLVSESHLRTVESYVNQGVEEGSKLITGGKVIVDDPKNDGNYFAPTLFDHVDEKSPLATEEIFGPVLPVLRVKNFDDVLRISNNTPYGLAAAMFCDDMKIINHFVRNIKTGMVHINHGTASQAHVPFGGVKQSGQGAYSIGPTVKEFYTNIKTIYLAWN